MGQFFAAFYTLNDNLEHALVPFFDGGLPSIKDVAFSPQTQGFLKVTLKREPDGRGGWPQPPISGVSSPVDNNPYIFYTGDLTYPDQICVVETVRYSSPIAQDVLIGPDPLVPACWEIRNMDAYFSPEDNLVHVLLLVVENANTLNEIGHIWHLFGAPWSNDPWTAIPFLFVQIPHPRNMCAYYSPQDGHGHAMVTSHSSFTDPANSLIDVSFTPHSTDQNTIAHFDTRNWDISGFYTPDDSFQHITAFNSDENVYEIVFKPGIQTPTMRTLGHVPIPSEHGAAVGAYVKPDGGRHVIMYFFSTIGSGADGPSENPYNLYLSWYYPGWPGFVYGLPTRHDGRVEISLESGWLQD